MKQMLREYGADASKRELELLKEELLSGIPVFHRIMLRFQIFTGFRKYCGKPMSRWSPSTSFCSSAWLWE